MPRVKGQKSARYVGKVCPICGDTYSVTEKRALVQKSCGKPACKSETVRRATIKSWEERKKKMKFKDLLGEESMEIVKSEQMRYARDGHNAKVALEFISNNPGVTAKEVREGSGYKTPGGAYAWLKRAVRAELIRERRMDGRIRYYSSNYVFSDEIKAKMSNADLIVLKNEELAKGKTPNFTIVTEKSVEVAPVQEPATNSSVELETLSPPDVQAPDGYATIEQAAKDFTWQFNGKNFEWERGELTVRNVLKEFVAYLKEQN